jgi:hypothetical protein
MKINNIKNFKGGWLVGNFQPSLFQTETNDIGVLFLKAGESGDGHYHLNHIEYNIILLGKAIVDGNELIGGDIFVYERGDKSYVTYLEDTILLVIKEPATKNDKYYDTNIT